MQFFRKYHRVIHRHQLARRLKDAPVQNWSRTLRFDADELLSGDWNSIDDSAIPVFVDDQLPK